MTPAKTHLSEEALAALVEGGLVGEEARLARAHLGGCRVCMAAYTDAVRLRSNWRSETPAVAEIAAPRSASPGRRTARLILAACLPLVLLAAAWFGLRGDDETYPGQDKLAPVLAEASHHDLILPGAGTASWQPAVPTRSGNGGAADEDDITPLLQDLEAAGRDSWAALAVAGYLAIDNRPMARIQLNREFGEGNDHPDLQVAAGVYAYRESDLAGARRRFEEALAQRPDDPVAGFNLALVLAEEGEVLEARERFRQLSHLEGHPLISHRAAQELARIDRGR